MAVDRLKTESSALYVIVLYRTAPMSDCSLTPPVFSPASNDDDAQLPDAHRKFDDRELRPMLTEFITKHRQQVSLCTILSLLYYLHCIIFTVLLTFIVLCIDANF